MDITSFDSNILTIDVVSLIVIPNQPLVKQGSTEELMDILQVRPRIISITLNVSSRIVKAIIQALANTIMVADQTID
ncbi:MAG: hypothetical protein EZS28_009031 [Streblomastix strix]|uniref:Uncharacterized protein n=1 Tax=Streblomastix strix TaxID=222440 RepID=A0A5J4WKQ7_9EUKA|nr:MAG: hypothetical protein EZS28_009031 [Streblomastix strix]